MGITTQVRGMDPPTPMDAGGPWSLGRCPQVAKIFTALFSKT